MAQTRQPERLCVGARLVSLSFGGMPPTGTQTKRPFMVV